MPEHVFQRSFAGGELAPALHARADQVKYTTGAKTMKNFMVMKEGGACNRSGFRFVDAIKDSTVDSTFLFAVLGTDEDDSVLVEAGNGYLRFFHAGGAVLVAAVPAYNGATAYVQGDLVLSGGVNYWAKAPTTGNAPPNAAFWYPMPAGNILEIPHPFATHRFNTSQDGSVVTLTHQDVAPQELVYLSLTRWTLGAIVTAPSIAAPTGLAVAQGTPGPGPLVATYVVTAAKAETFEESIASASAVTIGAPQLGTPNAPNALSWNAVAGAAEYYVYGDFAQNGVFGYLGTASTNAFKDTGFVPDLTVTPPQARTPFAGANNFPHVSETFQQRRFMASTANDPSGIWASKTGFRSNYSISSPLQDDDALTFRISGSGPVRWLVKLKQLVALAAAGEWTIGEAKQPLTPQSIPTDQEAYVGSHDKPPVVIGNSIVYLQARGAIFRELRFDRQIEGWAGKDLTVFSSHLFKGQTFAGFAYQQAPDSILWCVRNDGVLLGLTYLPDEEIWGWHRHETAGDFEQVCVVPEAGEDGVYVIVKRTIGTTTKRYIERLDERTIEDWDEDIFFVDSGLSYSGPAANHISGLDHLEGMVLAVVGDGAVVFDGDVTKTNAESFRVTGGAITLADSYENVHLGLPIQYGDLETLDLDIGGSSIRDKRKRIAGVALLVDTSSRSFWAGPDAATLRQYTPETWDPQGDSFSGQIFLNTESGFTDNGRVLIRQKDPLPLTILGVLPLVELGG